MVDKPLIIFDTDMDTDCDDAGALGLLLNFVKNDKAELLGIIADTPTEYAAPCCEAICDWYGINVPIGAVSEEKYASDPRFSEYRSHRNGIAEGKYYNAILARKIEKTDKDYCSAAIAYRKLLANAPDGGVTVVCVGLLTAIAELFGTSGDNISPLSGIELFRKKVKMVVSMGNADYPEQRKYNFNYKMDRIGTAEFFENCPVSVHISKAGTSIITGKYFSKNYSENHPLRIAYEAFMGGENIGRSSWDLIAVLYALNHESSIFKTNSYGKIGYNTDNVVFWSNNESRKDYAVELTVTDDEMTEIIEKMLIKGEN